ncbi:MAG TPA: TlpA disulfide reductase family protein [Phycisphaerales bacterium]|nr:TlpA disulfide reductase family protein [Phycisphaerales bacterium]
MNPATKTRLSDALRRSPLALAAGVALALSAGVARADDPEKKGGAGAPDAPAPKASPQPETQSARDGENRPPEKILEEYDGLAIPVAPEKYDADEFSRHMEKRAAIVDRIAELGMQLYRADPKHERAPELMARRWNMMVLEQHAPDKAIADTEAIISENQNPEVVSQAMYWNAIAVGRQSKFDPDKTMPAVERFLAHAPQDKRAAGMLLYLVNRWIDRSPERAGNLLDRLLKDYPDSEAAEQARPMARIVHGIGKPFELKFTDAVTGEQVDLASKFKGKVVVIDFWATWCRPCVAELPKLKEFYAKYKDRGVEIVSVSLDSEPSDGQPADAKTSSGKQKLLDFISQNQLGWYHFYQGKGWDSEFSKSWGITSIPRIFVVDADGALANSSARGRLEEVVEALLAKRDAKN